LPLHVHGNGTAERARRPLAGGGDRDGRGRGVEPARRRAARLHARHAAHRPAGLAGRPSLVLRLGDAARAARPLARLGVAFADLRLILWRAPAAGGRRGVPPAARLALGRIRRAPAARERAALGRSPPLRESGREAMFHRLLERLREEVSGERALESVRALTRFHRVQASPGYDRAADWLAGRLEAGGLEVERTTAPGDGRTRFLGQLMPQGWECVVGRATLVAGERRELLCD